MSTTSSKNCYRRILAELRSLANRPFKLETVEKLEFDDRIAPHKSVAK
ncbi:MAG: hypothetical protein IT422_22335 [Pirellulaceae bacterium]|nr:hypothetical protein [Pirellulaceae bacterium]